MAYRILQVKNQTAAFIAGMLLLFSSFYYLSRSIVDNYDAFRAISDHGEGQPTSLVGY